MAGPSLTKVREAEERLAAFKREVKEMQQRDRHASTPPPHARILGEAGDATADAYAGPSSSSRPLLPPLRPHATSFASPRELQAVAKQREAAVYAEYQLEREKIEREIQSAYQLELQKLHLQAKSTMVEQLDRRQREREMRAREHFELARRGIKREDVTVVTTASVPGHKVKEVCGTVTGSYMMREISEDAMPDEARITLSLARDEAYADLISEAQKLLANAVVSFRWQSRTIGYEATEMLATGTALRVEHDGPHACHECGSVKKGGKGGDTSGKGKGGKGGNDGGNAKGKGKQNHNDNSDEDEDEDDEWVKEEKKNQKGGKGGGGDNNGGGKGGGKGGKGGNNLSTSQQLVKLLLEAKVKEDKRTQTQMVRDQIFGMLDGFFQGQNPSFNPYSSGTLEWLNQAEQQRRTQAGGKDNAGGDKQGNGAGWGNDTDKGKKGGSWGGDAKKADAGWGDAASGEQAQAPTNPAAQKQAAKQKSKQTAAAAQTQGQTKDQQQQQQQQGKKGREKQATSAKEKDKEKNVSWGAEQQTSSNGSGSKTASKAPTPQPARGVSVGPASPAPAAWGAADADTLGWGASPGPGPATAVTRGGGQAQREPSPAWGGQNAGASNDEGWV